MSNEKTKLLRRASKEFTVKNVNCVAFSASSVINENGLKYILVDKSKSTVLDNITIHFNKNREMYPTGQMDTCEVVIQTPISLQDSFKYEPELFVIKFEDMLIMVYSLVGYNGEMKQYDYRGEVLQSKNEQFVIYDITEIKDSLLNNSMPIWLMNKDRLGISVYPSYLSPINMNEPYMSVEISDTKSLTMTDYYGAMDDYDTSDNYDTDGIYDEASSIGQWKEDTVRLYLMNCNTNLQQTIAYKIQRLSEEYLDYIFGVNTIVGFKSVYDDRQRGFGIVSNKAICDLRVNYYQQTTTFNDISIKLIKEIILKVNKTNLPEINLETEGEK